MPRSKERDDEYREKRGILKFWLFETAVESICNRCYLAMEQFIFFGFGTSESHKLYVRPNGFQILEIVKPLANTRGIPYRKILRF